MTASANISRIGLEPNVSGLAMDSTGVKHSTASDWRCELGPVASLDYKRGYGLYKVSLSAAPTVGQATVRFKAGTVTLATQVLDLTGGAQNYRGKLPISLAGLEGTQGILVQLEVDTSADAGITAALDAAVDVEVPLVGGC